MEATLPAPEASRTFPYANWGAGAAVLGVVLALGVGILLGIPVILVDSPPADGDLSTGANVAVQLATALAFLLVPLALAARWGARTLGEMLARLGVRGFRVGAALKWSAAAIGAYLLFAIVYAGIFGVPEQEDIAEGFGALPVQILLIAIAASISEELCFRGMLFGGLRNRYPRWIAAAIAALVFGALHALTGISAVPPLMAFGFILCLLYEKTGSIVPGIVLHMLNNSVALIGQ
ncbi:MAG TPA: type II CAAX endopeptidase family protein [Solirubrobacterales bacterium]|nr:type II CAAX endopeptidase family protein [Solirubrobacterales bacterium]